MAVLLVLSLVAAFLLLDFLLRKGTRRFQAMRDRARRKAILDVPVRLDFAFAARTLKRFEVPEPRARILAVDDEPVVLDSLRRILVVEGYSVDTVEHGPEALFLVQRNDYDVVLTDLVMPDMDGAEVVRAVKHLRPDMDVAVVTGFGTIESAVETMQYGGSDYLQKPFTPAELTVFLDRLLIRREERLRRSRPPQVRLIAPGEEEAAPTPGEHRIPGGVFLSAGHAWVRIEPDGGVRIGIDDFVQQAAGSVRQVALPRPGRVVQAGEPLFALQRDGRELRIAAPVSGTVVEGNPSLRRDARPIAATPYTSGWVCRMQPADLGAELPALRIGPPALAWYTRELLRLRALQADQEALDWADLEGHFLGQMQPPPTVAPETAMSGQDGCR